MLTKEEKYILWSITGALVLLVVFILFKKEGYMYPSGNFTSASPISGTGNLWSPTQSATVLSALQVDSSGNLSTAAPVPIGAIIMWGGAVSTIPTGWALCDGTNGTPDLRSRFVVGAANVQSVMQLLPTGPLTAYPAGTTGGEEAHALELSEIPSHTHNYAQNAGGPPTVSTLIYGGQTDNPGYYPTKPTGGDSTNNNATKPHNNLPPFFALAFIMKVA